ncbi:MAG: hypothetical protein WCG99_04420 [Candidatus Berkelbacteria bacterium]
MNKKVIIPAIVLGLVATSAVVWKTGIASAHFGGSQDNKDQMAQELAAKLNVSTDQVSTAFAQIRTEHQAERKIEVSTKLDQAVTDGVITADQKQKIVDKMAENQANRGNAQGQKGKNREAMDQWFSDNGMDSAKIHDYIGFGGRGSQK